ncbi:MAG: PDZ domain-containing protein [Nitrospirae bacterium]|nr:MAG: PDZ domain-containing protein [Nitrospirota bacterium]
MRHVAWVMTGLLIVASGSVSFAVEPYPEKNLGLTSTGSSSGPQSEAAADKKQKDIIAMAEEFGLIVGPVTEDIRKELNLRSAEGVAVFEVIGESLAEVAGIKVGAVIAEMNKKPVRNLEDFGRLLPELLKEGNFTVGTWEPTNPENQGQGGQMNFHFVPKRVD